MIQADGKIVVAGRHHHFDEASGQWPSGFGAARFLTDGRLDSGFGVGGVAWTPDGDAPSDFPCAAALQPDGNIVVAGTLQIFDGVSDQWVSMVVRYLGDVDVNHAPVLDPIGDKAVDEQQLLSFTVTASDPNDVPPDRVTLSSSVLPPGAGFDPATGVFAWTPGESQQGVYQVTFTATDDGSLSLADSELVTITVWEVNDAPLGADRTVTVLEETTYIFGAADFGFSDSNDSPPNALLAVKITTLPTAGSLTDNGVAVTAGQFIALADINGGKLAFDPAPNATGRNYAAFTFQVQDKGGTAHGGVDLDPTPRTMTINVQAARSLSISDVTVVEGDDALWDANFKVSLSAPSDLPVYVYVGTADGTAIAGSDYLAVTRYYVSFAPGGPLSKTISIPVVGDTVQENHEYFFVNLSDPYNATIRDGQGKGTILDADPLRGSIVQLTNNDGDERDLVIDSGQVAWTGASGSWGFPDVAADFRDIFLYDGATTRQLTDAKSLSDPRWENQVWYNSPDIDNGQVVYGGPAGLWPLPPDLNGVYLYDGAGTRRLAGGPGANPQIDEGQVTWDGYDATDTEVFLYDGTTTRQLTDNTWNDWEPRIECGQVAWFTFASNTPADESEIYFYDGISVRRLTENSYFDAWPDFDNGTVFWYAADGGNSIDYYLYDGAATRRLTNDDIFGALGPPLIDNGLVAFSGVVPFRDYNIYLYDGASASLLSRQPSDEYLSDIDAGQLVWTGGFGGRTVFLYDGTTIRRLSATRDGGSEPQIDGGQVAWSGWDGHDSEIYLYTPANHAPIATDDPYSAYAGTTLNVSAPGPLGSDIDADGDPLLAYVVDDVGHGSLTLNFDGSFTYQPEPGFVGVDRFTYRVFDGNHISNIATVSITVVADVDPPVAHLADPAAGSTVVDWQFNARGYLDVTFTDATQSGLDAATILDVAGEFTLSGPGAAGVVVNGTPELVSGDTYRYRFTGALADGTVNVDFTPGSFADLRGNVNAAATESFNVQVEPSLWIDTPQPLAEGTKGQKTLNFTVRLTQAVDQPVKVKYAMIPGTAGAKDYKSAKGTLTFKPGKPLVQTIRVPIIDDNLYEDAETFQMSLSGATAGIPIAVGTATGTILDNDPMPGLSIRDISVTEGNSGTTKATFTVTLSAASGKTTTVAYATADGTATVADGDYQAAAGALSFAPGVTKQTITVLVNGDTKYELNETLAVKLSDPVNATLLRDAGVATIKNDDAAPRLSIADVTVDEAADAAVFTLTLSAASGIPVTVNYATASKTARAPADFAAASGTVTFAPGSTTATISVSIVDDALREGNEVFLVKLSRAASAKIARSTATATIIDNDPLFNLSTESVAATRIADELAQSVLDEYTHRRRASRMSLKSTTTTLADEAIRSLTSS